MTDKEILFTYRITQAEEPLLDVEKMLQGGISPRSITNRIIAPMRRTRLV